VQFEYSERQLAARTLAAEIGERFDEDYWQQIDLKARFPEEFWATVADHGVLGTAIPKEYGGSGLGLLDLVIVAEALAENGAGMDGGGVFVNGPVFGGFLLTKHGNGEQKERYLPGAVRGDVWAGAFTESGSGSNIASIKTFAKRSKDGYVVEGRKLYISRMSRANRIAVLARTEERDVENKTRGLTLFIKDLPDPTISFTPLEKLGVHSQDANAVTISGMYVPQGNVIGNPGEAWRLVFDVLNPERVLLAGLAVGTGMLALRRAVDYAKQRKAWGDQPIGYYQGIQFPLAEARMHLAAARLKVYEAAWLCDLGAREYSVAASMAFYLAVHAALRAADQAIQTLGGAGYVSAGGVERHYRNLRLNRIAPVTDQMSLSAVAQYDLGLPRSYVE